MDSSHGGVPRSALDHLAAPMRAPIDAGARLLDPARAHLRRAVRRSLGVPGDPPSHPSSPDEVFLPQDSVARLVHGDLPSMIVGGLAALLLQTLHPLAMAGVAEHSSYREDPIGRFRRTASFVGATTFGTVAQAQHAINTVRDVHRHVHGTSPDGRRYSANDPELLTWVHVAEVHSFLRASERYGPYRLSAGERDRYYEETAGVARALGAQWVPRSAGEVEAYFLRVRPDLYAGSQALDARDFLLRGVARRPHDRAVHAAIAMAAVTVLPPWARTELRIPSVPLVGDRLVAPGARAFCTMLRLATRQ